QLARVGHLALKGSSAGIVRVHDGLTGEELFALPGDGQSQTAVAWSPDGRRLAVLSRSTFRWPLGLVRVWDLPGRRLLFSATTGGAEGPHLAWSPDSKRLAFVGAEQAVVVHDVATGQEAVRLPGTAVWNGWLAWSPDGKRIAGLICKAGGAVAKDTEL